MNKELKDLAWAAIPPQVRAEARREYAFHNRKDKYLVCDVLANIFGHHNLTSDTEPEEVLCCPRKRVQELYNEANSYGHADTLYRQGVVRALKDLFYDKCLPDTTEEKPTPTEPEPQETEETMEEKELNLAELLRDYIGFKCYNPTLGPVTLESISDEADDLKPLYWDGNIGRFYTYPDGRIYSESQPAIWPTRDLYLKYPLYPKAAWQEWAESRKPKRDHLVKVSWSDITDDANIGDAESIDSLTESEAGELIARIKKEIHEFRLEMEDKYAEQ